MTVMEQPVADGQNSSAKPKKSFSSIIPTVIVLLGVLLLAYPLVATLVANQQQAGQARVYQDQVDRLDPEQIEAEIASAHRWNEGQTDGPILDPWLARVEEDNAEYQEYLEQLNLTDAMSTISIPSISSSLPVYHGTTDDVLQKGVGHLFGTSLPVGGKSTRAVLTGHTGLSQATLWDNLKEVEKGDGIYIDTLGQKMKYEVHKIEVVLPNETDNLKVVQNQDLVTLITCTPYGVNSHRLLVHAHRVPMDDEDVFNKTYTPWQWWMTVVVAVLALVLLTAITIALRNLKKKRLALQQLADETE